VEAISFAITMAIVNMVHERILDLVSKIPIAFIRENVMIHKARQNAFRNKNRKWKK
jgi:hypothetical protein